MEPSESRQLHRIPHARLHQWSLGYVPGWDRHRSKRCYASILHALVKVLLELAHDYAVQPDAELPIGKPDGQLFEFSAGLPSGARNRCLVQVRPGERADWTGRFVGDYDEPPAISIVSSSPDPRKVCVVCSGRGYIVDTARPDEFDLVECFPICSVTTIRSAAVIVFGNFTDLAAYDRGGLSWKATKLVSDELSIVEIENGLITVEGLNAMSGSSMRITVDARTGAVVDARGKG